MSRRDDTMVGNGNFGNTMSRSISVSQRGNVHHVGDEDYIGPAPDVVTAVIASVNDALTAIRSESNTEIQDVGSGSNNWSEHLTNFVLPPVEEITFNHSNHEIRLPLKNVQLILSASRLMEEIQKRGQYTVDMLIESGTSGLTISLVVGLASTTIKKFNEAVESLKVQHGIGNHGKLPKRQKQGTAQRVIRFLFFTFVFGTLLLAMYILLDKVHGHSSSSEQQQQQQQ